MANPPRKESVQIVTQFVLDVYICITAVLNITMKPYKIIPEQFYVDEKTLFSLYEPNKKSPETEDNRTFGLDTYYGSCYQLLLNLRNWFNNNIDFIEQ
jgi:hypothetical protein